MNQPKKQRTPLLCREILPRLGDGGNAERRILNDDDSIEIPVLPKWERIATSRIKSEMMPCQPEERGIAGLEVG